MTVTAHDNNKEISTDENHSKFLAFLEASNEAVWHFAQWLWGRGYSVYIPVQRKAPRHSDWKQYSDNGDLKAKKDGEGHWRKIEVKRLSVDFTSPEDWAFGEKFIVCGKHTYDRARMKPHTYVILSSDMLHCATVDVKDTRSEWYVEKRVDSRYTDVEREFYFVPIELVKWFPLDQEKR